MQKFQRNDKAVTELIGVVLLISVAVVAIGIVAVVLFSEPLPEEVPNVDILITNGTKTVYITHGGGEPVGEGEITVYVNGVLVNGTLDNGMLKIDGGDGLWPWTIGETLNFTLIDIEDIEEVHVVYSGGSTDALLKSKRLTDVSPDTNPDVVPRPTIPPCVWTIDDLFKDAIYLSQDLISGSNEWNITGNFTFTIAENDDYLVFGPFTGSEGVINKTFKPGDQVIIQCGAIKNSISSVRIFALNNIGWHLHADNVYVYHNGAQITDNSGKVLTNILGGRLSGYDAQGSKVNIYSKLGSASEVYTLLMFDNGILIDRMLTKANSEITIIGIKPTNPTLFILDSYGKTAGAPSYFVGKADSPPITNL
jgi:FlaG/FlaF family flagellin (archaellin)